MRISRRKFITISLASLPTLVGSGKAEVRRGRRPVAAVLEHTEAKTGHSTGAEVLLKRAGFDVIRLTPKAIRRDLSTSFMVRFYDDRDRSTEIRRRIEAPRYEFPLGPDPEKLDLIFFGTFANQGQPYHDYLRRYAHQIPEFVAAGGVVCEMSQWGRYSCLHPRFLPSGMEVARETWSSTDDVVVVVEDHPMVTPWAGSAGSALDYPSPPPRPGRFYEGGRSWESIAEWKGMRVLLAAGGGYRGSDLRQPGRAALLEGEHGRGRYLFTSLWLDKVFGEDGSISVHPRTKLVAEGFFRSLRDYVESIRGGRGVLVEPTPMRPEPWVGPMLGHVDHEQAIIWARADKDGVFTLRVWREGEKPEMGRTLAGRAALAHDYCLHWRMEDLEPNVRYQYCIEQDGLRLFEGRDFEFATGPAPGQRAKVALAFGSCVDQNGRFSGLWKQIESSGADGMVLLGDSPYIDSTVAVHHRIKHREFLLQEGPAYLSRKIPFWGTWDDHDFGANGSTGQVHNRQGMRQVFKDYRALTHYGEKDEGVYTSFRRGPMEVFLLDLRYFAETEPSFADPGRPTLIGGRQWKWLQAGLKASDAPFKILAGGMTWDSKQAVSRTDDWETYHYEREAVIDFIGKERIEGVLLVGGDIHCTQVMKYATEDRIGYPLYHVVASPMHNRVAPLHEMLDRPGLLFARAEPVTFVRITADSTVEPGLLTVEVIDISGRCIYRLVTGDELGVSVRP